MLYGPPGCGKTLLARALAGETGVPFYSVSAASFVEQMVGLGAARVRQLFDEARRAAPSIVFIDELDAIGRSRDNQSSGGREFDHTLNQLLVELDGFGGATGVLLIGATNRPELIDSALLRPGRFDRRIQVERPDRQGREQILRLHGVPAAGVAAGQLGRGGGRHLRAQRLRAGQHRQRGGTPGGPPPPGCDRAGERLGGGGPGRRGHRQLPG